jgi:hypothetical protein
MTFRRPSPATFFRTRPQKSSNSADLPFICGLVRKNVGRASAASEAIQIFDRAPGVLRRSEGTCFSSPSDDEVGGYQRAPALSEPWRAKQSK